MSLKNTFIFFLIIHCLSPTITNAQENSLLYKIDGKNLNRPSYIYGTFHLMCKADLDISENLNICITNTDQIALEIDMDDPKLMMKMMRGMKMNGDTSLSDLLSIIDFEKLKEYVKDQVSMPFMMLKNMKPFMMFSLLLPSILNCDLMGYEQEFMKIAKTQNKEILGLESIELQMEVFDKIPYKTQAKSLMETINKIDSTKLEFRNMVDVYKSKDINKLKDLVNQTDDLYAGFEDILLNDRNKNWIPVISEMMYTKPTFIAVGAGHLAGEMGVLNLLRKEGYTVSSVY